METVLLGLLLSWPCVSAGASLTGEVVSILDGNTIEVLNGHHVERIRLSGID
jgi:endonuclease YncB( thermonuclease family)